MTLTKVAKQARVSTSTVSRVLNQPSLVKKSTRVRVLKAIEQYKYHPNMYARVLAGRKNYTLGMVVSNIENPFFLDIFRSLEDEARRRGYEVAVANTDYAPKRLVSAVHLMIERRVAGLAVIVSETDPTLFEELKHCNLPVVFYDVGQAGGCITRIHVNYRSGMKKAVTYLYSLGHRKMTFVGHHSSLQPLHHRKEAFLQAIQQYAGEVESATVAERDGPEGGRQATATLLASGFKPTAILCVNDFMAIGAMQALRDRGLKIPEDVSITGYDNIRLSSFLSPALTTLDIPRDQIGRRAFQALVPEKGDSAVVGNEVCIEPQLIVRESTGPAPRASGAEGFVVNGAPPRAA